VKSCEIRQVSGEVSGEVPEVPFEFVTEINEKTRKILKNFSISSLKPQKYWIM
jgi:hypothetical protein